MATIKQIGIYTESSSSWGVHDIGADAINIDLSSTNYRASEVQGALNEIAGRMSATDNSISSMRGDITEIQQEIETLPSSTVFDRINTLSTSVTNLASSVSSLNTNSANFASSISSLNTRITNNTSAINQRPTSTQVSTMITNGTSSFLPSASIDSRIAASTKGLATTAYVAGSTSGLATETFVTNKTAGLASQAWVNSQLSSTVSVLQTSITANSNFINSFKTKPAIKTGFVRVYLNDNELVSNHEVWIRAKKTFWSRQMIQKGTQTITTDEYNIVDSDYVFFTWGTPSTRNWKGNVYLTAADTDRNRSIWIMNVIQTGSTPAIGVKVYYIRKDLVPDNTYGEDENRGLVD